MTFTDQQIKNEQHKRISHNKISFKMWKNMLVRALFMPRMACNEQLFLIAKLLYQSNCLWVQFIQINNNINSILIVKCQGKLNVKKFEAKTIKSKKKGSLSICNKEFSSPLNRYGSPRVASHRSWEGYKYFFLFFFFGGGCSFLLLSSLFYPRFWLHLNCEGIKRIGAYVHIYVIVYVSVPKYLTKSLAVNR